MPAISFEIFNQRYEDSQARPSGGGSEYWKPVQAPLGLPPHRNIIRMMEAHPNMLVRLPDGRTGHDPIVVTKVHYGLGPKQDVMSPCLEFFGLPCPACSWVDDLFKMAKNEPNPVLMKQQKDLAFRIRAKFQFYASIVDLFNPAVGVQTWRFGPELEKMVRERFYDNSPQRQFRDITDPVMGRNLVLDVGSKPGRTPQDQPFPDYRSMQVDDPSPLADPTWVQQIKDLTTEVYQPSADQVKAALQGQRVTRQQPTVLTAGSAVPQGVLTPGAAPQAVLVPGLPRAQAATVLPQSPVATFLAPPVASAAPGNGPVQGITLVPSTPAAAPVAVPTPGASATTAAPAVATPAKRGRKAAVTAAQAAAAPPATTDPMALALAEIHRLGFMTPEITTPDKLDRPSLPPCYGIEQDVNEQVCRECPAIVPCRAIMMNLMPAT